MATMAANNWFGGFLAQWRLNDTEAVSIYSETVADNGEIATFRDFVVSNYWQNAGEMTQHH